MIFDKIFPPANIHMIGIGGVSMSGLAEILLNKGYKVSGSDAADSLIINRLKMSGIKVSIGHDAKNIKNADAVIFTAAIKEDNPEYMEAKKRGIPLIERSVLLGEITRMYKDTIAISGTHGKTTTTSMISSAFINAKKDPTISVGGELDVINGNYRIGDSDFFITEACEYVESFLEFSPKVEVILNIEEDHLDYYRDIEHIKSAFFKFTNRLVEGGTLVINADDKNCKSVLDMTNCNAITFGINNTAKYMARNITFEADFLTYDLYKNNEFLRNVSLKVLGLHNVYNSLATIAVCDIYGINLDNVLDALAEFSGAKRRFEKKGEYNGAMVYDDYAHHPSEIKATLSVARTKCKNKVWCVFQPHTYTRTKMLLDEFSNAFYDADKVIITDIYAARERDNGEVTSYDLVKKMENTSNNALYMKNFSEIEEFLKENLNSGDLFLTIGAGDVYKVGENIIKN